MYRLFTIIVGVFLPFLGFAKPIFPDLTYCTPAVVKENISFEKLQIGTWLISQSNTALSITAFGSTPSYEFSLQGFPQTRDTFYWQLWLDLNQDLDFDDEGENFLKVAVPRKQKATGKLEFPAGFSGQRRMRIMLSRTKANNPCGTQAKVMDYRDFWLQGNCPEIDVSTQVNVRKVLEEEISLGFSWPSETKFQWRIKGQEETDWPQSGTADGDSLRLKELKDFNTYNFQYRLHCGNEKWTNWSDTLTLETLYKAICRPISLSDLRIDSVGVNYVYLNVSPQNNSEQFEYLILSDRGKGDTVTGFNAYGQFKASLKLVGSLYSVQVRKHCLNGGVSEWTNRDKFAFNTLPLPCSTPEVKIYKESTTPYAQASIKGKTAYEWRWRLSGTKDWTTRLNTTDTLSLIPLDSIHVYELQVRAECIPDFWTDWSLNYQVSTDRFCPPPSLDSFTVDYHNRARIYYKGVEYSHITWDFTPRTSGCKEKYSAFPKYLDLFTLRGERAYVRMKGLCISGIEGGYSDTLWLDQPCSKLTSNQIRVVAITNNSAIVSTSDISFCDGMEYLVAKDSTLPDAMWQSYLRTDRHSITGLEPNTKYYLKGRQLCSGGGQKAEFSRIYTFATSAEAPGPCLPLDTTQFKVEFRAPYSIAIILSPELHHSADLFYCHVNGLDGYSGGYSGNYVKDSILYSQIWVDTRHKISINRVCGDEWSKDGFSKIFVAPNMPCPKLNPHKIEEDYFAGSDGYVVFNKNAPTKYTPYLWRYRAWGTQGWEDTIVSTTEKIKLPLKHLGAFYHVQIKPLNPANCTDNWSESKFIETACPSVYLTSKKLQGNTLEVTCNAIDSVFEWAYRAEGHSAWTKIITGNKLLIKDLLPNTNYKLEIKSQCQMGNPFVRIYSTNFTTKSCFFDSLKIAHEFIYPNLLTLKTNLPTGHKTHRISHFDWEWQPYLRYRFYNTNADTITLLNPTPGTTYKISLKYTCDLFYNPEQFKMFYHEVTIPRTEQLSAKVADAEVHELRVIPNPSQGQFNLELPEVSETSADLYILNLSGQIVHRAKVQLSPGALLPLDLSQHPQGVYQVNLQVGNQLYREKLVLIR